MPHDVASEDQSVPLSYPDIMLIGAIQAVLC